MRFIEGIATVSAELRSATLISKKGIGKLEWHLNWRTSHKFSTQVAFDLLAGDLARHPNSTLSKFFYFFICFFSGVDKQSAAAVRSHFINLDCPT